MIREEIKIPIRYRLCYYSLVEPFHFYPAPASQDGGFGSSSSSVVHNVFAVKIKL